MGNILFGLRGRLLLVLLFLDLYFLEVRTLTSGPFNPPPLLDNPPYHFPAIPTQLRLYSSSVVYWQGGVAQYSSSAGIAMRFVRLSSAPPQRTFVDLKCVAYHQ